MFKNYQEILKKISQSEGKSPLRIIPTWVYLFCLLIISHLGVINTPLRIAAAFTACGIVLILIMLRENRRISEKGILNERELRIFKTVNIFYWCIGMAGSALVIIS